MTESQRQFLFRLLETPSPTGSEMPGQRVWAESLQAAADEVTCDAYGSTWATLAGTGNSSIMLAAHADEIGWMIRHIQDDGFIRIDRVGGSDHATSRGRRLRLLGDQGEVAGIIGNTAIHLRRGSLNDEKAPKVHELWVDVGASSAEEVAAMGLRVGHFAVYADGPTELAHKRLVSRALDNRIGSFIIAEVLKRVAAADGRPASHLICLNAIQEEIGGHGAVMATYRLKPDLCLCLDVTHATDTPDIDLNQHGKVTLGGGPTVTHGTANHPKIVEHLTELARAHDIPLQHEASSRVTGTDTDKIFHQVGGVPSALVSLPLRCMHSVVETAHLDDIEHTIQLLTRFVQSVTDPQAFHQSL
jgi:endoglucanase